MTTPSADSASAATPNSASSPTATAKVVLPSEQGGFWNDLKILWHLAVTRGRGETHEQRLENFYKGQASGYDAFRKRMLHGRKELFADLELPNGGVWIDLGAGTGENAENWGDRISQLGKGYLVDLSSSLLKIADARIQARNWSNIVTQHADATKFVPPEGQVDLVTCSYSLTMIPDWFAAIDQAYQLLKPGGRIGIVDFYVARKFPADGRSQHRWSTRSFWPVWFAQDNVFPSPDHLPYLCNKFIPETVSEHLGKIPYLPFVRAPYYRFIGRKPE